jgi:hypothetical protein
MQIFGIIGAAWSAIVFYLTLLAQKLTLKVFAFAAVAGLALTLYATALSNLNTLTKIIPPDLIILWGHLAPPNALACITAILGTKTSIALYEWTASLIMKFVS